MTPPSLSADAIFSELPFDLICAVLRELAVDGVVSGHLARTAALCLVSSAVCRFVRPILYHTFVIPQSEHSAAVLERLVATSTSENPDAETPLGYVRRVCLLGGYGAWQPMPDAVLRALTCNPRNLEAVSAQSVTYAQLCAAAPTRFRPREVYFRHDVLDDVLHSQHPRILVSLERATHVLGIFPQWFPTPHDFHVGHHTDERIHRILDALPKVTHLALFVHEYAWTPSIGYVPETGLKPGFLRRVAHAVFEHRRRLEMLVLDVTSLTPEEQEDARNLVDDEFPGGRVRVLVDARDERLGLGFVNLWERDWLAGRGVWDGSEADVEYES